MAGTELGKAYVQIIPSAEGISGKIKGVLDPEAQAAGESSGKGYSSTFGDMLKANLASTAITGAFDKVTGLAKEAASKAVDVIKDSVMAFADYEQLIGGVETLFKDSAGRVEQYAAEAFHTAGLSANEYMETVTSFSASLLQSLAGDTEAAADMANLAITDMSDNANKMGTDMASIQNAYQGFAKQNYTINYPMSAA